MAIQKKHYDIEKAGQIDFFNNYRIDYQGDKSILIDNTDGVYQGNIMEFKLNISNTGKVLFQAIKYLSRMRVKGESIPARILLIDLNATKVYVYNSADYIDDIQKVYVGASSKGNDAFAKDITPVAEYDYSNMVDSAKVLELLINKNADWYIPIDLDEDCIVGWAERYYREIPKATKGDFLGDGTGKINLNGEIRDPKHFAGLINPYTEPTNEKFKYLMDCLNDRLNKKDLGAFYTPEPYCQKAAELVEMAVARVPDGNDYIILDRCAGTGNLESALYGRYDKNGDELISHCVVSTYEYYEYKVLLERIGQDVRNIIPPTEANVVYENGKVSNADAMSKDYIDNPLIKQYVDNPNCTIILFENPPYFDSSSITYTEGDDKSVRKTTSSKTSYVCENFKTELKKYGSVQASARELSNLFIWSAKKFYLRQPTDSYIVFSPVKYFKNVNLLSLHCEKAFAFNRKYFHATDSVISCILWTNIEDLTDTWDLLLFDIDKDENLIDLSNSITVRQAMESIAKFNDKRTFDDDIESDVVCNSDGTELLGWSHKTKHSVYNDNIIAYMAANGFISDVKHRYLSRCGNRAGVEQSYGFMVRRDNYLEKLPMWVSKIYPMDNWFDKDVYYNTSDGGDAYTKDKVFLKSCLIYTCLSNQNKCMSFNGSDGRYYRNELCFDTTNGNTVASADLAKMILDEEEKKLMTLWENILAEAKKTANYDPNLTYGVYQITKELNTSHKEGTGTSKKTVYDYPNLNRYLVSLRDNLKAYYKSHITDKMFKYELLK
jgi:hypothetical protein